MKLQLLLLLALPAVAQTIAIDPKSGVYLGAADSRIDGKALGVK